MTKRWSFPPHLTFLAALAGVVLLGVVDYATAMSWASLIFYFVPIAAAAWRLGARMGSAVALVSAGSGSRGLGRGHRYSHPSLAVWDAGIRLVAFLSIAVAVAKIQALLGKERQSAEELREALRQVKTSPASSPSVPLQEDSER